uniref:Uncharacterized protein n=1 Tax=Xenopus tropicalis TaxID=8364 RepID=A0A6I8QMK3_XENTR
MVKGCCTQTLYYEELHSYRMVPYVAENVIYGMGYTNSSLAQNSPLLIYTVKE